MPSTLARQPIVHFLVLGAALFFVRSPTAAVREPIDRTIVVGEMRAGNRDVSAWIEEEVLVREALARGLEKDPVVDRRIAIALKFSGGDGDELRASLLRTDPVVRRRLAQSMRFALENSTEVAEPDAAAIDLHLAERARQRSHLELYSFEILTFAKDAATGREASSRRIQDALRRLRSGKPPAAVDSDSLALPPTVAMTRDRIAAYYGPSFAEALGGLTEGSWSGPLASVHGLHVVRVRERQRAPTLPAPMAREQAIVDLIAARRAEALDEAMRNLVARYDVRRTQDSH